MVWLWLKARIPAYFQTQACDKKWCSFWDGSFFPFRIDEPVKEALEDIKDKTTFLKISAPTRNSNPELKILKFGGLRAVGKLELFRIRPEGNL